MSHFKASKVNFSDSFQLVVQIVAFHLLANVSEHTISAALPDVEGFPVSRIDEPVHVCLQLAGHA
jgi:hypothetical protein